MSAGFSPHHVAISVTDIGRSEAFYEFFGFQQVMRWQSDDGGLIIVQMQLDGLLLEMFCYASHHSGDVAERSLNADLKEVGTRHFGLKVADIEEVRDQLIQAGLLDARTTVIRGRTGIDYLFLRDPDGLFVEIVQDDRDFMQVSSAR